MSDFIHSSVTEKAQALRPSGQVWYERLVEDQLPLARQVAALLGRTAIGQEFDEIGYWISGVPGNSVFYPWAFKDEEVSVQGPPLWGYDPETGAPKQTTPPITDLTRPRGYLTADGRIIETSTGDPDTLPASVELAEQTVWFIPRPADHHPIALISAERTLLEGTGFLCAGNWIALFEDPWELWPERVIPSFSTRVARSWKSTTLRTDRLQTAGREIALYKRNNQNLKQFERALCEVAGLRVLDEDGRITRLEIGGNLAMHWLEDGRSFSLPVTSPYTQDEVVPAGSGHILHLRHQSLQGADWWRARYWGSSGIPIFAFRQGFYGFSVRDESVPVVTYDDDGFLRAMLVFNQDPDAETLFWTWQAAQERRAGVETFAIDVLGLDADDLQPLLDSSGNPMLQADGEPLFVSESPALQSRNALEVFAGMCGSWLAVVETSLDAVNPTAFREVRDFIIRERPAGTQVYCAGTGEAFSTPLYYEVYLNTGELVEIEEDVTLAIPLGY